MKQEGGGDSRLEEAFKRWAEKGEQAFAPNPSRNLLSAAAPAGAEGRSGSGGGFSVQGLATAKPRLTDVLLDRYLQHLQLTGQEAPDPGAAPSLWRCSTAQSTVLLPTAMWRSSEPWFGGPMAMPWLAWPQWQDPYRGMDVSGRNPWGSLPPEASNCSSRARLEAVAIWNLSPEYDGKTLNQELFEIDFQPQCVRAMHSEGAFLLFYTDACLATAVIVALNDTKGVLRDNGDLVRLARCDDDSSSDVPVQLLQQQCSRTHARI